MSQKRGMEQRIFTDPGSTSTAAPALEKRPQLSRMVGLALVIVPAWLYHSYAQSAEVAPDSVYGLAFATSGTLLLLVVGAGYALHKRWATRWPEHLWQVGNPRRSSSLLYQVARSGSESSRCQSCALQARTGIRRTSQEQPALRREYCEHPLAVCCQSPGAQRSYLECPRTSGAQAFWHLRAIAP